MINVFLDTETVATEREDIRQRVVELVKPPRSMKRAETIAKWEAEEKPAALAAALDTMALNGATAEIKIIGYAVEDADPVLLHTMDEADMIRLFLEHIGDRAKYQHGARQAVRIVAHNAKFDIDMLFKRCVLLGIPRPHWFPWRYRPWDFERVFCTMRAWDADNFTSLDNLCFYLGIPSPKAKGITGANVGQLIKDGGILQAAGYCGDDVIAMRKCAYALALEGDAL